MASRRPGDLKALVLGDGEPLADERAETLDLLLDGDTEVVDGVPVGVGHGAMEPHLLGTAAEGSVWHQGSRPYAVRVKRGRG